MLLNWTKLQVKDLYVVHCGKWLTKRRKKVRHQPVQVIIQISLLLYTLRTMATGSVEINIINATSNSSIITLIRRKMCSLVLVATRTVKTGEHFPVREKSEFYPKYWKNLEKKTLENTQKVRENCQSVRVKPYKYGTIL